MLLTSPKFAAAVDKVIDNNATVKSLVTDVGILKTDVAILKTDVASMKIDISIIKDQFHLMGLKFEAMCSKFDGVMDVMMDTRETLLRQNVSIDRLQKKAEKTDFLEAALKSHVRNKSLHRTK